MKIMSFGEIIWDVYSDKMLLGGAPFNFASHVAKLGAESYSITTLGNDTKGKQAFECMKKMGINTEFVGFSDKQTGQCIVKLDRHGLPKYTLLDNTSYDNINVPVKSKINIDAFYFGTLALRSDENRINIVNILKNINTTEIFCDLNIREPFYSDNSINLCLSLSTIIKISDEELPIVSKSVFKGKTLDYKEFAGKIAEKYKNIHLIIITLGDKGAYILDCKNKTEYSQNAIKTNVISTVGAGDSFSAMFLYTYLFGESIEECINSAVKLSSFVVSKEEAVPDYSIDEI